MTLNSLRNRRTVEYLCHWCKTTMQPAYPYYATPCDGVEPYGSVGWVVCSPACPDRPQDALVFKRGA